MDDVVLVQIVDGIKDLLDGLGSILFGELPLLADTVKEFTTGGELSDDVELVLEEAHQRQYCASCSMGVEVAPNAMTYPRFEPVNKLDNVWVL